MIRFVIPLLEISDKVWDKFFEKNSKARALRSKSLYLLKFERVKELLIYDELNLAGIDYLMHYRSVVHLSLLPGSEK